MGCKLNKYKERSTRRKSGRRKEWKRRKAGNGRNEGEKMQVLKKGLRITV
jgi:hypothetical protein